MQLLSYTTLWGALGCYIWGFLRLWAKRPQATTTYGLLALGWGLQGLGLYAWGCYLGMCPLMSAFEGYCFLSWSLGLLTLVVGPTLGFRAFTLLGIGLSLALGCIAWLVAAVTPEPSATRMGFELHAALALLAYGFFGLLALSAALALLQDYALRTKRFRGFFDSLPPFPQLERLHARLLLSGLGLYCLAWMSASWSFSGAQLSDTKRALTAGTVLAYLWLYLLGRNRGFWQRPFCPSAIALFVLLVLSLGMYWR